jgi:2,4-dienoyl-CoA reductase (NADPH2)
MTQFQRLFEPVKIGNVELKNRIVMLCGNASGGGKNRIPHFAERAAGGTGLLIIGGMATWDLGAAETRYLARTTDMDEASGLWDFSLYSDEIIPWLRQFTTAMHNNGAKVAAQILMTYEWKRDWKTNRGAPTEVVGASNVASGPRMGDSRALTVDEIHEIVEEQGDAAKVAREAGFDAVEIHAGMGYLFNRFLSPRSNKRNDEYGGSIENRARIVLESVESVRKKAGSDYPIIVRLSAADFMEEGNTLEDTKPMAVLLERAGVASIDVEAGWHESPVPMIQEWVPRGTFVYLADEIKKMVNIPVICGYRITDPFLAEEIVALGQADLVGMSRQLIADAEFPNKAREGRVDEIRPCIACCRCLDLVREGGRSGCTVNAMVAREAEYSIDPAAKSRKVLVIGGGPAGLEAARVAAVRGHKVTLYEKEPKLGGQVSLAALRPGRGELEALLDYFRNEMQRLGVEMKLGQKFSPDILAAEKPDVIVIAAGATPIRPPIPGIEDGKVTYASEVLTGQVETGERVVIIGGGATGVETALFLAKKGAITSDAALHLISTGAADAKFAVALATRGPKKVTILEMLGRIGADIGMSTRWALLGELRRDGVEMITKAKVEKITQSGAVYTQDGEERLAEADTVVIAMGAESDNRLVEALKGEHFEVHAIGDCVKPRKILEAIHEGAAVGRTI